MIDEQRDVFQPLAQRGHLDRHHVEPVEEVLAKAAGGDGLGENHVGGGDHAAIGLDRVGSADALESAVLEHAQQLGLHSQGHLADLVEEQSASLRQVEPAFLLAIGAGEGPAFVAEELAFEKVLGQRRAVDGDQRPAARDVAEMNRLGDQFLARAGFARDEDGARRRSDPRDALEHLGHAGALAQQVMVSRLSLEPAAQIGDFVDQPPVFERMIAPEPRD